MTQEEKEFYRSEFRKNFKSLHKMLSAWVVGIASLAAAYWLQLSPEDQQALLAEYPKMIKAAPFFTMAAWMWARSKPQRSLTPPPETPNDSEGPPN